MKNKRKRLIIIGGWERLYKKANDLEFDVTVIQEKEKIKNEDFKLIDQLITMNIDDCDIVDILKTLHNKNPFDCVISMEEKGLLTAALVQRELGIQGNPIEPVLLTKDKGRMREHLINSGLNSIPYKIIQTTNDVIKFIKEVDLPIILKPIDGTGSRQIHKIDKENQILQALNSIKLEYSSSQIIAEKFIDGIEVSVEAFSWNGDHKIVAITDKVTSGSPFFVELSHSIPSTLPEKILIDIKNLTSNFLTSIGHIMGPSHTEMIVVNNVPYIIESHTRAGGDYIYDLVDLVYKVDLYKLLLVGLAGMNPEINFVREANAAMIKYLNLGNGTILDIKNPKEVEIDPKIHRYEINLFPGKKIELFTRSSDRYGYFIAKGNSKNEVELAIDNSIENFCIKFK